MEPFLGHWRTLGSPALQTWKVTNCSRIRREPDRKARQLPSPPTQPLPGCAPQLNPTQGGSRCCPNLGWRECGQLRGVSRERARAAHPGDLRGRGSVPWIDAGTERVRSARGHPRVRRARGVSEATAAVGRESCTGPRRARGARLPNSPARRREGDATASHPPQVRWAAMALAQAQTQKVGIPKSTANRWRRGVEQRKKPRPSALV